MEAPDFVPPTYPQSCRTITIGPGRYLPETGGYTTTDSEWDIPLELYGKVRAYVYCGYVF